jgi:membrane-associated phospholipid phosphatase
MKNYLAPIIFKLKHDYGRVRPYYLDKCIKPTAPKPKHAAYPSGHATQAHFIAEIFSEKYSSKTAWYYSLATRVATNREAAGVHYESDSKYGKIVGETIANYVNLDDFLNC